MKTKKLCSRFIQAQKYRLKSYINLKTSLGVFTAHISFFSSVSLVIVKNNEIHRQIIPLTKKYLTSACLLINTLSRHTACVC